MSAENAQFDPKYWLDRADEIRAYADAMKDAYARQIMLRIASDYLRLSDFARSERAAKKNSPDAPADK